MQNFLRSIVLLTLLVAGCENTQFGAREKGALTGGAIGAGLGAIIGNQAGSTGAGIATGSAIGALSGGIIGNDIDNQDQAQNARSQQLDEQDRQIEENRRLIEELRSRGTDARLTKRGVVINLPDVLFEFDRATLTQSARRTCGEIGEVLRSSPARHISVEGNTDSVGSLNYNQRLSEDRARNVADELVNNGVPRRDISVIGYGETRPIASNKTEAGRERNRRVEVVIENR